MIDILRAQPRAWSEGGLIEWQIAERERRLTKLLA
jgi:hypothetical protein